MPLDLKALNASVDAITAEVSRTEGTEESAGKLIAGISAAISKAVTDALTADNAANQTSIDAPQAVRYRNRRRPNPEKCSPAPTPSDPPA